MTPIRRGHGLVLGDRLLLIMLVVLIIGAPTVFLRTAMMPFYIPQLTFLWIVAVLVWFLGIYRVVVSGILHRGPRSLAVVSIAFMSALILSSILSPQPWVAFTGLPVRGGGAFFYLLCMGLLYASFGLTRRGSAQPLVLAFAATHGLVVLYALLQGYGMDPISWGSDASQVGNLVFSTLGNSNFSSGFVGLTLPLLVWVAFGSSYHAVTKVVGGAAVGASVVALVYLNSFQGQVSALVASVVLVQWAMTRSSRDRLLALLIVFPVGAAIIGLPFVLTAPSGLALLATMVGSAVCAIAGARYDSKRVDQTNRELAGETGRWFWPTAVAVVGVGAVVGVLFRSRIVEQVESGLEQRFEFWKVSLSIFRDSPLVGRGLETFLTYFTTYRSVDHAVKWEGLLSNSPHSELIGMLSGGGLILVGTYLAVLGLVGYFGVRAVRRAEGSSQLFYGAVFAAWLGYQVQASVSAGATGVFYAQWVLAGVLVAGGSPSVLPSRILPWKPLVRHRERQSNSSFGLRPLVTGCALVAVFVYCLGPLSAPLRASMAVHRAQLALFRADPVAAEVELARAIKLDPRNGYYAESMAFLHEQGGFHESSFDEIDRAARLQPGIPYVALKAAKSAFLVNRLDTAESWYEHAVDSDPNGVTAITEAAAFHARTGSPDRAADLLESFEWLRSPRTASWKTAADAYEYLGVKDHAVHLRRCADPWWEEVGCFDDSMMQD